MVKVYLTLHLSMPVCLNVIYPHELSQESIAEHLLPNVEVLYSNPDMVQIVAQSL